MHGPQISKENLHTVPERKNGSPQEKSWVTVAKQLPTCCMSNNNIEPMNQPVRKVYSYTIRKSIEEKLRG